MALLAAVLSISATRASAEGSPAAPASPRYPLSAFVRVQADASPDRLYALPLQRSTLEIGDQMRAAYEGVAGRMFRPGFGSEPDRDLWIDVTVASIDLRMGGGGRVIVEHAVSIRSGAGTEIARIDVRGESPILGFDESDIARAFARAASTAARSFEREFDASAPMRAWLAERGIALAEVEPPRATPARTSSVFFLDGGAALGEGKELGFGLRGGFSTRRVALGFSVDHVFTVIERVRFQATAVGMDAGIAWRFADSYEARVGAGVRAYRGYASLEYLDALEWRQRSITEWGLGGSGYVAVQSASLPRAILGARGRVGIEARLNMGRRAWAYDALRVDAGFPETLVVLFAGGEIPVRRGGP